MNNPGRMRLAQPPPDLRGDVDSVINRHRPPLDPLLERLPLVVRHHEVELAVGGLLLLGVTALVFLHGHPVVRNGQHPVLRVSGVACWRRCRARFDTLPTPIEFLVGTGL